MAVKSLAAVAGLLVATVTVTATQWDQLNPDPNRFSNVSIPQVRNKLSPMDATEFQGF